MATETTKKAIVSVKTVTTETSKKFKVSEVWKKEGFKPISKKEEHNGKPRVKRMGHVDYVKKEGVYTTKEELGISVKCAELKGEKCYLLTVRGANAYATKKEDGGIKLTLKERNTERVTNRYSVDSANLINNNNLALDTNGFAYMEKLVKGYKFDELKKYVAWEEKKKVSK